MQFDISLNASNYTINSFHCSHRNKKFSKVHNFLICIAGFYVGPRGRLGGRLLNPGPPGSFLRPKPLFPALWGGGGGWLEHPLNQPSTLPELPRSQLGDPSGLFSPPRSANSKHLTANSKQQKAFPHILLSWLLLPSPESKCSNGLLNSVLHTQ